MAEQDSPSPEAAINGTTGLDSESLDDTELDDTELDHVSGGLEISTDIASRRVQQELYDAGSAHQVAFPRLTSRFDGSPSGT